MENSEEQNQAKFPQTVQFSYQINMPPKDRPLPVRNHLTLNCFGSLRILKSGSSSTASSRLCRNIFWNCTISWMLPNNCSMSSPDKNVSSLSGSRYRSIKHIRSCKVKSNHFNYNLIIQPSKQFFSKIHSLMLSLETLALYYS